jgi:hypothetical protein
MRTGKRAPRGADLFGSENDEEERDGDDAGEAPPAIPPSPPAPAAAEVVGLTIDQRRALGVTTPAEGSLIECRWSKEKGWLRVRDPHTGEVHEVSSTNAQVPKSWRREASQRISDERLRSAQRTTGRTDTWRQEG